MANSTAKNNLLDNNKSMLSDDYGIVVDDSFKTEMVDNLYSENSLKLNEITENQFVRTNADRNLTSKLTIEPVGTMEFAKSSTLNLGDFQLEMQDGALVIKTK